ncbi:GTP-binding protein TrmE N-terminus-domain-containing protein [Thamnocephalis sphaerospora]|uniref:GTP-binding protein TrmE N-terminus-domain-containing protein n=1 Tax=Thamnocephalis sphaerospora TaxID=78915 RepID=A0A4P9XFP5_9FUNG|nr:GTP-binding protein TrmE N-terminus-domain-containing protein [Thamnocephalis sphaerospora]|eukprot:RKP04397.1 GTP-binding protein TrmE N-terminus-domain-containing protein [Thamnocephalis sphaerospora]
MALRQCAARASRLLVHGSRLFSHTASDDTIYALSSGASKAGVAVIRVSGPNCQQIFDRVATGKGHRPAPRAATFASFKHPHTGELLDRGLLLWFPGPKSFTGEDVVELHVHGGTAVVNGVLGALGTLERFRFAERGEFARRAFENDKLDLTSVEGLVDLINAETEAQRRQALRQAGGQLRKQYDRWRQELIESQALVEALIDFGEDENIEDGVYDQGKRLQQSHDR